MPVQRKMLTASEIAVRLMHEYEVNGATRTEAMVSELLRRKRRSLDQRMRQLRQQIDACLSCLVAVRQENQLLLQQNDLLLRVRTAARRG